MGISENDDFEKIGTTVNKIYKQAVKKFDFSIDENWKLGSTNWKQLAAELAALDPDNYSAASLENEDWKLILGADHDRKDFTPIMRTIAAAYRKSIDYEGATRYLFLIPSLTKGDEKGYFPRSKPFGFIQAKGTDLSLTIAHELGHGHANLKHAWDEFPDLSKKTSPLLMDYNEGKHLTYKEWGKVNYDKWTKEFVKTQSTLKVFYALKESECGYNLYSGIVTKDEFDKTVAVQSKNTDSEFTYTDPLLDLSLPTTYFDGATTAEENGTKSLLNCLKHPFSKFLMKYIAQVHNMTDKDELIKILDEFKELKIVGLDEKSLENDIATEKRLNLNNETSINNFFTEIKGKKDATNSNLSALILNIYLLDDEDKNLFLNGEDLGSIEKIVDAYKSECWKDIPAAKGQFVPLCMWEGYAGKQYAAKDLPLIAGTTDGLLSAVGELLESISIPYLFFFQNYDCNEETADEDLKKLYGKMSEISDNFDFGDFSLNEEEWKKLEKNKTLKKINEKGFWDYFTGNFSNDLEKGFKKDDYKAVRYYLMNEYQFLEKPVIKELKLIIDNTPEGQKKQNCEVVKKKVEETLKMMDSFVGFFKNEKNGEGINETKVQLYEGIIKELAQTVEGTSGTSNIERYNQGRLLGAIISGILGDKGASKLAKVTGFTKLVGKITVPLKKVLGDGVNMVGDAVKIGSKIIFRYADGVLLDVVIQPVVSLGDYKIVKNLGKVRYKLKGKTETLTGNLALVVDAGTYYVIKIGKTVGKTVLKSIDWTNDFSKKASKFIEDLIDDQKGYLIEKTKNVYSFFYKKDGIEIEVADIDINNRNINSKPLDGDTEIMESTQSMAINCNGPKCNIGNNCFIAGTPVITKTGLKAIETIEKNDLIASFDEVKQDTVWSKVTNTFSNWTNQIVKVFIGQDTLQSTPNHPFYIPKKKRYILADSLRKGVILLSLSGQLLAVDSVATIDTSAQVYNFEVANQHNYFVGNQGVLVHNDCRIDALKGLKSGQRKKLNKFLDNSGWDDDLKKAFVKDLPARNNNLIDYFSTGDVEKKAKAWKMLAESNPESPKIRLDPENLDLCVTILDKNLWRNLKGFDFKKIQDGINNSKSKKRLIDALAEAQTPEAFAEAFRTAGRKVDIPPGGKIDTKKLPDANLTNGKGKLTTDYEKAKKEYEAWKKQREDPNATPDEKRLASEQVAEYATDMHMAELGYKKLDFEWPNNGKQGQFDRIYQDVDGNLIFVECKGGGSTLGSRILKKREEGTGKEVVALQGTPEYRDDIIDNMLEKLRKTKSTDSEIVRKNKEIIRKLVKAKDKIADTKYLYTNTPVNKGLIGPLIVKQFR